MSLERENQRSASPSSALRRSTCQPTTAATATNVTERVA
jgi:hypothetical protein